MRYALAAVCLAAALATSCRKGPKYDEGKTSAVPPATEIPTPAPAKK